jgi:hypothetical protein
MLLACCTRDAMRHYQRLTEASHVTMHEAQKGQPVTAAGAGKGHDRNCGAAAWWFGALVMHGRFSKFTT